MALTTALKHAQRLPCWRHSSLAPLPPALLNSRSWPFPAQHENSSLEPRLSPLPAEGRRAEKPALAPRSSVLQSHTHCQGQGRNQGGCCAPPSGMLPTATSPLAPLQRTDTVACSASAAAASSATPDPRRILFCPQCGSPTVRLTPEGDEKERDVCSSSACAAVNFENPKLVVGAVCLWEDKVLLCKRAIEPCKGLWGFPQGYMELGETSMQGAEREVWEESGARAEVEGLLAVYNVPNRVVLVYLAELLSPEMHPGKESAEVSLFAQDEIPYDQLAFPTVKWALDYLFSLDTKSGSSLVPQQRNKVIQLNQEGRPDPRLGSWQANAKAL